MITLQIGIVKFYNDGKKFGFIKNDNTKEDIYVSKQNILGIIKKNDKVLFYQEKDKKGLQANYVINIATIDKIAFINFGATRLLAGKSSVGLCLLEKCDYGHRSILEVFAEEHKTDGNIFKIRDFEMKISNDNKLKKDYLKDIEKYKI